MTNETEKQGDNSKHNSTPSTPIKENNKDEKPVFPNFESIRSYTIRPGWEKDKK